MQTSAQAPAAVIRRLTPADIDRIVQIEQAAYPFPWSRGIFEDCLRVGYDCEGLQLGTALAGYVVQVRGGSESHLLNLCIAPEWQRMGYGSLLLEQAIRLAQRGGCDSMFLEVRPSNASGIRLYERRGFHIIGRRKDYYRAADGREDAIVMRMNLQPEVPRATGAPPRDPF